MDKKMIDLLEIDIEREKLNYVIIFEFIFAFTWVFFYQELKDSIMIFYYDLGMETVVKYVLLLVLVKTFVLALFDFLYLLIIFFVSFKDNERCYYFDPLVVLLLLIKLKNAKDDKLQSSTRYLKYQYLIPLFQVLGVFFCVIIYMFVKDTNVNTHKQVIENFLKFDVNNNNGTNIQHINLIMLKYLFELKMTEIKPNMIIMEFIVVTICISVIYLININKSIKERNIMIPSAIAFFDVLSSIFGSHSGIFLKCLFLSIINYEYICLLINICVFLVYLYFFASYKANTSNNIISITNDNNDNINNNKIILENKTVKNHDDGDVEYIKIADKREHEKINNNQKINKELNLNDFIQKFILKK